MRVQLARRLERDAEGYYAEAWRLCEPDGSLCVNWAPGLEHDDPEGPLDRGGFDRRTDALAFKLGVDRWRAEKGLIPETVADIDAERRKLDGGRPLPELDDLQLDTEPPPVAPSWSDAFLLEANSGAW